MHELSIAVSIVEALRFSYGIACEGTSLEGSQLLIDDTQGTDLEVIALEIE
jgi:Zn finger protein HypA/HybF involved in hydrogenase expression